LALNCQWLLLYHLGYRFKPLWFFFLRHSSTLSYLMGTRILIISSIHLPFTTCPERGFSLRSWWGQFAKSCEFLSRQWNCIFSPLDVSPSSSSHLISLVEHCSELFITLENHEPSSGVEPGSSRSVVRSSSTALASPGIKLL
jgi:hypothetical protein